MPSTAKVQLLLDADGGAQRGPAGDAQRKGRGQRVAEHRLKGHAAGGQGRAGHERHHHPRNPQLPEDVDLGVWSSTSPHRARNGMRSMPQNGAIAEHRHGQQQQKVDRPAAAHRIFSRACCRHLASSFSCSGVMRGTIIGRPALGWSTISSDVP